MLEKVRNRLTSIPATILGGVFLILSYVLSKLGHTLPVDPAWITVIISGLPLLYSAIRKLIREHGLSKISSALLITVAMIAAVAIGDLFAAGEVAFIMALGEILEDFTTDRARKGLNKLIELTPTQGRRIRDGREELILAKDIRLGDILRILPGETVPVDGIITDGETSVDQSILTGESLPVERTVGDEIFCGTINRFGSVDIRASKVGEDSSLQKLIRMVREAEAKKAPTARIADRAASFLVPAALLIAIITYFATRNIVRAVTVLVVFCPCALVLATPTAIMAAIGQATRHGVIIKSGEALERMGHVNTAAFDKTGTLTHGTLSVCDIISFSDNRSQNDILALAASAEAKSEHPLARAILSYATSSDINISEITDFSMRAGRGVSAKIGGKRVFCGNEDFLREHSITISANAEHTLDKLRSEGKASVLVAANEECIGVVALSDVLRDESSEVVTKLKEMNIECVLLTGDNKKAAEHMATNVGIQNVHGELLPEDKVNRIHELRRHGSCVCMVGDGVNDAPALKSADIGIAMGCMGSDIALDAADIALMRDDIASLPYLIKLSRATVRTINAGITLSMVINVVAVLLSVLGVLTPTTGALVHNLGSCLVILIAALLYDRRF